MTDDILAPVSAADCRSLLSRHEVGRVAVNDDRGPVVLPVNYHLDRGDIVFRTAEGTKLSAARDTQPASFLVDEIDEERRLGVSVLLRGELVEIDDPEEFERVTAGWEPFPEGERPHVVRLEVDSMTGRRIPLPAHLPHDWHELTGTNTWYGRDGDDLLG